MLQLDVSQWLQQENTVTTKSRQTSGHFCYNPDCTKSATTGLTLSAILGLAMEGMVLQQAFQG